MRVAIVRDLDTTANSCFEGAPEPHYFTPCLDTYPALCRSICYRSEKTPLLLNFPPPLLRRPISSKRGLQGSSARSIKAKHALVPVMMGGAAAQRFTLLVFLPSQRSRKPGLVRRRADQDLWARFYRLRLRLRKPYSSVCVVEC